VEFTMNRSVSHPTKEQVRAYMAARELAHRPPPSLEEIRHQLNWHLDPSPGCTFAGCSMLPAAFVQLAAQFALDWCLVPLRAQLAAGCAETRPYDPAMPQHMAALWLLSATPPRGHS
jgi:hypothetical protein